MVKHCLNCQSELTGPYCHKCGQKASTHRITFGGFIRHDLPHGLFHYDKGVLFTIKSLLIRPGTAIRGFLAGQRVSHYNIFALYIFVVVIKVLIDGIADYDLEFRSKSHPESDAMANSLLDRFYKLLYLVNIPVLAFWSFIFFRRPRYNFTEHMVMNCFILTGGFIYGLPLAILGAIMNDYEISAIYLLCVTVYIIFSFYQLTKREYHILDFAWRVILMLALYASSMIAGFLILMQFFYPGLFVGTFGPRVP